MLNIYYKPSCPFCQRVLQAGDDLGLTFTLHDVSADATLQEELIKKGGKKQVPFLEDINRDEMLYESDDIITYLAKHYGNGKTTVIPHAGNVCPID